MAPDAKTLLDMIARQKADDEFSVHDEVQAIAASQGWAPVLKAAFDLLKDRAHSDAWYEALEIVYYGHDNKSALPDEVRECIARMYWCLEQDDFPETEYADNMVWSAVHGWLGLPYTDPWGPGDDPDIVRRIERMTRER